MLRVLILCGLAGAPPVMADNEQFATANSRADNAQAETRTALDDVATIDVAEALPSFSESVKRSETVPAGRFPTLANELTDPDTLETVGELMDNAEALAGDLGLASDAGRRLSVYVFVSFSMPDASLRRLIEQGELAGAPVVLRGLVNNSIEDTARAVRALYAEVEEHEDGAVIDPTLFERFRVDQVPTVVVAEYAAGACTPEACPTPAHVKVAGDVPMRYALDRIALAKPAYRHELRNRMKKLEPGRTW